MHEAWTRRNRRVSAALWGSAGARGNFVVEAVSLSVKVYWACRVEPEARRRSEMARESQGSVCSDGPLAVDDLVDPARWDADVLGPVLGQPVLGKDLEGNNLR